MDEWEAYLYAQREEFLRKGLHKHAERLTAMIDEYKKLKAERAKIDAEREQLQSQMNALPRSRYLDLLDNSLQLSVKLDKLFSKIEDTNLELEIRNTFNEYTANNNDMLTEMLTQLELRRMDELEKQIKKDE